MKKSLNRFLKTQFFISVFIFSFLSFILAGNPSITSVTMSPANPMFGDAVQVTVTYCGQLYQDHYIDIAISSQPTRDNADVSGSGQVFVVSRAGVDVHTSQPALTPGGQIGFLAQTQPGAVAADCMTCGSGSNDGKRFTKVYDVHVPDASYYPGCNVTQLYLHVGMKDNNIGAGEWQGLAACQTNTLPGWTIGTLPRNYSISKRVEGVIQDVGDLVLYSIDYEYWNGGLTITDPIPTPPTGSLELVSWGPASIVGGSFSGPGVGATTGTATWTMPDRTGQPGKASGTVWILCRVKTAMTAGGVINNTASGNQTGTGVKNASTNLTIGQAAISIVKQVSDPIAALGDTITYYLSYQINGSKLVAYQPFDDIGTGAYGDPSGLTGSPPPGWRFQPQGGTNGRWTISDMCSTGDRYITGDTTNNDTFPGLLYDGLPAANHLCNGIILSDVMIDPTGYEGADAMVVIRSNGLPGGKAYGLVLSIDDNIGTNAGGNVGFQRCIGATCIWPASANTVALTGNTWWRAKIEIAPPPASNQYEFRAKVWKKGDPEPAGWTVTWTDPTGAADGMDCNNGDTWRPGVAEQHGATGSTRDSYNNFVIYEPRTSANTNLYDTVPTGITYVGQQGPDPVVTTSPMVRWNLGLITDEGGTFTWWGTTNSCTTITNKGAIDGDNPILPVISNEVVTVVNCITQTSITKTASPVLVRLGETVTFTLSYCNTGQLPINPYYVWDTKPTFMTYVGSSPAATITGNVYSWNRGNLAIGACGSVQWWGTVDTMPLNPIMTREFFVYCGMDEEFTKIMISQK